MIFPALYMKDQQIIFGEWLDELSIQMTMLSTKNRMNISGIRLRQKRNICSYKRAEGKYQNLRYSKSILRCAIDRETAILSAMLVDLGGRQNVLTAEEIKHPDGTYSLVLKQNLQNIKSSLVDG